MKGVAAEYDALRRHAVVIDRSDRGRVRFSGPKAVDALNGLVTNDVAAIKPGGGAYAAALTAKGKIVSDLRIFVRDDSVLVDCPARPWSGWWDLVRKYVNPRLATYRDERETLHDLGVVGPDSHTVLGGLVKADADVLRRMEPYAHADLDMDGERVMVARTPDLTVQGFDVFATPARIAALRGRATDLGIVTASAEAWSIANVESGRPVWGVDIDETTLPQEVNLEELHAISYTKGCYTGQEIVARLHFRGHVNKRLIGLRAEVAEPPASGAVLIDGAGKQVGDVRSTATSPRLGGIALGMLRREVEAGASVTAKWSEGELAMQVVALPFPS
jgi:folate-binding protein YgfZ